MPQLLDQITLAVAAVDHDRQVELVGQLQVAAEPILLDRERRPVPVAVEPGLAQRDDPGRPARSTIVGPVRLGGLGRVVGMDADRGEDPAMRPGQLQDRGAVRGRRADGDDLDDPGLPARSRTPSSRCAAGVVQVGVGVDQRAM